MQKRTDWYITGRTWLVIDAILAFITVLLAYSYNEDLNVSWNSTIQNQPSAYLAAISYALFLSVCCNIVGLQDPLRQRRFWPNMGRTLIGVSSGMACFLLFLYLAFLFQLGRTVGIQIFVTSIFILLIIRMIIWRISSHSNRKILLFLPRKERIHLAAMIKLSGLPFETASLNESEFNRHNNSGQLIELCKSLKADELVIDHQSFSQDNNPWIKCLSHGIQVSSKSSFLERYFYKVSCSKLGVSWLLELDLRLTHPIYHRWKRLFDIVIALVGLLLTLPLIAAISLVILVESGRPVFYKQKRVGLRGNPFTIWKFRTMFVHSSESNSRWASKNDDRITWVGKLLRRTRFDEIPQFWNILTGEMSMIGPRPEWTDISEIWSQKISLYPYRHLVKPGLTGWAQINYPYAATEEDVLEKLSYDFYYMKHASALLDLQIILRTISAIMKGAR